MGKKVDHQKPKKRILLACEESQMITSKIYALNDEPNQAYFYDVWSCDLFPSSFEGDEKIRSRHIQGDVTYFLIYDQEYEKELETKIKNLNKDLDSLKQTNPDAIEKQNLLQQELEEAKKLEEQYKNVFPQKEKTPSWDLMIAHPPCTYLAVSGAKWFTKPKNSNLEINYHPKFPERKVDRAKAIRFLMILAMAPIKQIMIENPVGTLSNNLKLGDYNIGLSEKGKQEGQIDCFPNLVSIEELKKASIKTFHQYLSSYRLPNWDELKQLRIKWSNGESSNMDWLEKPRQIVQPYHFGDPATKSTCLWAKQDFKLLPTVSLDGDIDKGERVVLKSGKSLPKWYSDALTLSKTPEERRKLRSKTFPGFANAIVNQIVKEQKK